MDLINMQIIDLLKENSKYTNKEIGEIIHMTGQAVGIRINKLIDESIIKGYTIDVDDEKMGISLTAIIKILMMTHDHAKIKNLIKAEPHIVEAYRVSSDGCYFLKVTVENNQQLDDLLEKINLFANYQLSIVVNKLK